MVFTLRFDLNPNFGLIYPIESRPYGYSYNEWSAKWWQWLLSISKPSSPAFDSSGKNAGVQQKYPNVFFLCQTYEKSGVIPKRSISLPKDKAIFIPIINWISLMHHDGETDKELFDKATKSMDVIGDMKISINGITLKENLRNFRALSPFFEVELPQDNIIGISPGRRRAISDGYWILFKPLQTEISLTSVGSCSSGATKIGVDYEIILW